MADENPTTEEWRPVVGHDDTHEVSSLGRIRRVRDGGPSRAGRIIVGWPTKDGYTKVQLSRRGHVWRLHQIVAIAFIGPCPKGREVNHKDGVKSNNRPENLEYIPHVDNMRHAEGLGLISHLGGVASGKAKLTEQQVLAIRDTKRTGVSVAELARRFSVGETTVREIVTRRNWRDL